MGPDIDLSMNLPPQPSAADLDGRILRGIGALQRERGFAPWLSYRESGGSEEERSIAATWLRGCDLDATADRVVITPGAQGAIFGLLSLLVGNGETVLCECLTFPGFKAAASELDVAVAGIAMDAEGIVPDALAAAAQRYSARLLYLTPSIHNPTTATMSQRRREAIAEVIARHDLVLLEDDAYGRLAPEVAPIASLIPERSWLIASLSKCIAPGLRTALVVAPDRAAAASLAGVMRALLQMPAPIMVALVVSWLQDGSADAIIRAIRSEAMARQKVAAETLPAGSYAAHPAGHHIWLQLPEDWSLASFATHLQRRGLAVVTGDAFAVDTAVPQAVRVALGAARNRPDLARALQLLADALHAPGSGQGV
jgi:DNA-binding transcriptional MocR family regulator